MTTYKTGNAVGSPAIKDLYDNSENLDKAVNDRKSETWVDRLGVKRVSLFGAEQKNERLIEHFNIEMTQAVTAAGYITVDSFQQGAQLPNNELTQRNHILRDETTGEYYRWDGDLPKRVPAGSTPQSTGGIGKGAWVSVGDASLRGDIKSNSGASIIGTESGEGVQQVIDRLHREIVGIDIAELGYVYGSGADIQPYLDNFLSKYNGTGVNLLISQDCVINNVAWLNGIPNNVHLKVINDAVITANMTNPTNNTNHYALINLRGNRGNNIVVVTDDINEGQNFIMVSDATQISVNSFIEIDLRESEIVADMLSRQVATPCQVLKVEGKKIYIDYVFPFSMKFAVGGKRNVYTDLTMSSSCSIDINYKDITSLAGAECYGVHLFHSVNCHTDIICSGVISNGVMHTFTTGCTTNGYGTDARVTTSGLGYLCKVSASKNHHFYELLGVNMRHALDYSNTSYCTGDLLVDSGSATGFTTHGISENNISIKKVSTGTIAIAESGQEFGYHSKNISFGEVICDTFLCGYVENLEIKSGKIGTLQVRRGGTYTLCASVDSLEWHGRNGRTGAISHQGVTANNSAIGKYTFTRCDYFYTYRCTLLKWGVSNAFSVLKIRHVEMENEGHQEIMSGVGFDYRWFNGKLNDNLLDNKPAISTSRMTGGNTYIKVSGCELTGTGSTGMKLFQALQFSDTGVNNIIVDISNNKINNMAIDAAGVSSSYNIKKIAYLGNLRESSPAFAASYVVNNDVTI